MLHLLALLCLICALGLLILLSAIDLKTRLLPNKFVVPFALLGIAFHALTGFHWLSPLAMIGGGALCYGVLYGVRAMANHIYQRDTLGLGDVKLMGAAGLWLGPETVMLALSAGAAAGVIHGVVYAFWLAIKTKTSPQFKALQIPAGPGLAVGIVIGGLLLFHEFRPFAG